MNSESSEAAPHTEGLYVSLRRLGATTIAIAHTRLELFSTEVQEEMVRAVSMLLWGFFALFFASMGIAFGAFAIVVGLWETHRLGAAVSLTVLFLVLAAGAVLAIRRIVRARPRLFAASLAELAKDHEQLSGQ